MANSIIGTQSTPPTANPSLAQQFNAFKRTVTGNPQQIVMGMLDRGQITQAQLSQAMETAKRLSGVLK